MVQQVAIPESVASMELLDRVVYEDAFLAHTPTSRSAEEWMRLALDSAPTGFMQGVRIVQTALGLNLQPESSDHPLGWEILHNEPGVMILGAGGDGGAARLVSTATKQSWTVTTQADFGLRTRALWLFAAPLHRAVARLLMSRAIKASTP